MTMPSLEETYVGSPIDDTEVLRELPDYLASSLRVVNGFIRYGGGLHLRGACLLPLWHSIRAAWRGSLAFHTLYEEVLPTDVPFVPFAEDCMGDQFLLRDGVVFELAAESGQVRTLEVELPEFLTRAAEEPVEFLQMHPLLQFQAEGRQLKPGELLAAYPPFCLQAEGERVSLRAISTEERRGFLADVARQIRDVPDGGIVQFEVGRDPNGRPRRGSS
jgi:hypothetical protein